LHDVGVELQAFLLAAPGFTDEMVTSDRLYLDHNATTPLRPEARAAMLAALDVAASASSPHAEGRHARHILEAAREDVAALVGAEPRQVILTASATEANVTALTPHWQRACADPPLARLLLSAVEHASVRSGGRFGENREILPVDAQGRADRKLWARRMGELHGAGERPLVSLMAANNETGVLQPVADVAETVHAAGGLLHCDAAQAAGKIPLSIAALGADLLTLSSHKLGGPLGAGALVLASASLHLAEPLLRGGGQERGARAGTENIAAIAGFGAAASAARAALSEEGARQRALRDRLEREMRALAPGLIIFGEGAERLPNTLCFADVGSPAETMLMALDLEGIALSAGAACSSGRITGSHVLAAMGVSADVARCALRLSIGHTTIESDVHRFLSDWNRVRKRIHDRQGAEAA
jgi:cysteine desulfurase